MNYVRFLMKFETFCIEALTCETTPYTGLELRSTKTLIKTNKILLRKIFKLENCLHCQSVSFYYDKESCICIYFNSDFLGLDFVFL